MDYQRYVEALSAGNDAEFVREWYTEDCILQRGPQVLRGRRELLDFLERAHDGIREVVNVRTVLQGGDHVFAECDIEFHATRDKPEFEFGPLAQGEFLTVKYFALYLLRDGKVAHFKVSTWPPETAARVTRSE